MGVNVGTVDRLFRALLGVLLVGAPYVTQFEIWANPAARFGVPIVGVILLATAAIKFCPLYRIVGVRTCKPS